MDFLANLGPRVERVEGFQAGVNADGCVDRSVLAVFRYSTGAVGTLSYSWETASALRGLRLSHVYGREGSIAFEIERPVPGGVGAAHETHRVPGAG